MVKQRMQEGSALFVSRSGSLLFENPISIISCHTAGKVSECLDAVNAHLLEGRHVAGFIAYEAGIPILEMSAIPQATETPLVWFGVYDGYIKVDNPPVPEGNQPKLDWIPGLSGELYAQQASMIRNYIAAGDTYQVNFTFPITTHYEGDPLDWFAALYAAQPTEYAAYLDLEDIKILSLSPELFFQLEGEQLTTRPMKGTRSRAPHVEADARRAAELRDNPKDRAENLMIVDLLRNDMGRISVTGSVTVPNLFSVERYATVWQMTSTIRSRTHASFSEIVRALFPCGSVTGAPKIRTMEIIHGLEGVPRGIYCGTIGWAAPDRKAVFNVAIRTITYNRETKKAVYPVGSGVTWDSSATNEYEECLLKAAALSTPRIHFELLETLLYDGDYFLLEGHMERLQSSAAYFDIPLDVTRIIDDLNALGTRLTPGRWQVRLLVEQNGRFRLEHASAPVAREMTLGLALHPVSRDTLWLYHKTTRREIYNQALEARPGCDDVMLWNEAGELTETTRANLLVRMAGKWYTPPVECGLLPGTMRAEALRLGEVRERTIHKTELPNIQELALINSVRKKIPARWCGDV